MKRRMLICLAIVFVSLQSFAQGKTKGFYINPNLSFSSGYGYYINKKVNFSPQLSVGYLWGNTNRHNFSLNMFQIGRNERSNFIGIGLRYNYDVLLYRTKRMSLFISPYAKVNSNFSNYKLNTPNIIQKGNLQSYSLQLGFSPVIEYKLGKRIDLIASTPINLLSMTKSKFTTTNNDIKQTTYWEGFQSRPSLQANIGVRFNLFKKK